MNKEIEELLTRGVDRIYPSRDELEKVLHSGKKLTLYQGFDPTGDKLHIGHMVGLLKLRDWQTLGHRVIFLIGDGTGQAGDPSGKIKSRETFFNRASLRSNALNYVKQAQILKFKFKTRFNGEWLDKLTLPKILEIAGHFSLQQLVERDLFQERMKRGETLSLREALYPLLQAYDSVFMDVDLEVGGSDQTFNMLFGRTLMKTMKGKEKFVMTTPLITDASGRKIGKTEGNAVALIGASQQLYAQIMSLPDEVIVKSLECLTRVSTDRVREVERAINNGENPMIYKKELAFEIVSLLHDPQTAKEAQENFINTFSEKGVPADIQVVTASKGTSLVEVFLKYKIVSSKTEFNRLNKAGAIKEIEKGVYRIGKHRFLKIEVL